MGRPTTAAPLLLCLAAACGGTVEGNPGNSAAPIEAAPKTARPALSGVLAGGAAGLHFRTQMLEGLTDASGTFIYYEGETVSFHLGDIVLGSAPAAPNLDLFQIAGGVAPTTERDLIAAVLDTDTVDGFDRAANAAMLLLAFDRDDDGTNGIELGGLDLALTGKALELDREHGTFVDDLGAYAQRAAMTWNAIEPADAIAYIYASIGVRIAAHARRVTFRDDNLADATYDIVTTIAYDEDGRVSSSSELVTNPSLPDTQTVYVRDQRGRETRRETVSTFDPSLAQPASTFVVQTNRDLCGQPLLSSETNLQGAALRYSRTDERSRDPVGRVMESETVTDRNGDATPDEEQHRTFAYDRVTVRYNETFSSDLAGRYLATSLLEFGADGLVALRHDTNDANSDGVVDTDYQVEYQRDARGLVARTIELSRTAAGAQPSRTTTTYLRDPDGRVLSGTTTFDGPQTYVQQHFYDAAHRSLGFVATQDNDGDGVAEYRHVVEIQRDAEGNVVSRETRASTRALAPGTETITSRYLFTQTFEGGVPVRQENRDDLNGDGAFESQRSRRFEYVVIPNGVRHIVANARQWFE
ncbi:MAG TPA: hypothetical protein VLC93_10430 [Myxococcota bacterium]|nr:hypothetical protein [Myxococcota bacterium]